MSVFIVDDDKAICNILNRAVSKTNETVLAHSLTSAKKKLEEYHPHIAIIDLNLGDGNGSELIPLLPPSCVIIVISATRNPAEQVSGIIDEHEHYILKKPFKITEVMDIVKKANIHHALNELNKVKIGTGIIRAADAVADRLKKLQEGEG